MIRSVERQMTNRLREASRKLDAWIEGQQFRGWDPHDALNSHLLRRLTFGNRLLGIAWVQLLKRSPINVRALLRIPKGYNPKGMGLFLSSYLRKSRMSGAPEHLERVRLLARWLQENVSIGYSGACWGYNFDWPNRGSLVPAGTPTVVNTAFIALAFLDLKTGLDSPYAENGDPMQSVVANALSIARSACEFVLRDLNLTQPAADELCFSYTPLDRFCIHNANLMGAWLLSEVSMHTRERHLAERALAAARYSVRRQRPDGSWPYGEGGSYSWIDNFHTGFVLVALKHVAARLGVDEFDDTIDRGYGFWKDHFFLPDGKPKYYHNNLYPIDVHCVSQAIMTFLAFADDDTDATDRAWWLALWGIEQMQDLRGYFHYQIHRRYRITIPYIRWSQGWMQRALTELQWIGVAQDSQPARG